MAAYPAAGAARPVVVRAAVGLLLAAAVLLVTGGLLTAVTVNFATLREVAPAAVPDDAVRSSLWLYRGAGLLFAAGGAGLAATTLGAFRGDPRLRRTTVALAMALVVLVVLAAVVVGTHVLVVLAALPLIAGTVLLGRPSALDWYASKGGGDDWADPIS